MGKYFSNMSEEREKEIMQALIDKYGKMSIYDLDKEFRWPRYVDPVSHEELDRRWRQRFMQDDEAGQWDTSLIDKHWKVGAKQGDNQSQGNIQFNKPIEFKTMDKWARATQAAESVIEENLAQVSRISIWLTGGTVMNSKSGDQSSMAINASIVDHQGETMKLRYDIPKEMLDELDTEKAAFGYAVEIITNHLVLPQYFDKFA